MEQHIAFSKLVIGLRLRCPQRCSRSCFREESSKETEKKTGSGREQSYGNGLGEGFCRYGLAMAKGTGKVLARARAARPGGWEEEQPAVVVHCHGTQTNGRIEPEHEPEHGRIETGSGLA